MYKSVQFLFVFLVILIVYPIIFGYIIEKYENSLILNNTEEIEIFALIDYKYRIRRKESMSLDPNSQNPLYNIYLNFISVKDYKGENIDDCLPNNFESGKKITFSYSKRLMYLIPLEFYSFECKT